MRHSWRCFANRILYLLIVASCLAALCRAQAIAPVITVDHGPNAPQQISEPYVILVSLDGPADMRKRHHANICQRRSRGASAGKECFLLSFRSRFRTITASLLTPILASRHCTTVL